MEKKSKDQSYIKWIVIIVILYAVYTNPNSRKTIDEVTGNVSETINTVENTIALTSSDADVPEASQRGDTEVVRWHTSEETTPADKNASRINFDENSRINSAIRNYVMPKVEENIRYDLMRKGIIGDHSVVPGEFKTISYKPQPGSHIAICGSKVQLHYRVSDDKGEVYIDTSKDKEEPITVTLGSDTENAIPKGVELTLLGMSEKSTKTIRIARDLLDHPDIVFNQKHADEPLVDKKSEHTDGMSDPDLSETEIVPNDGDTKQADTLIKLHKSYLLNLELVSIDHDTRKASPEFVKVFNTSYSFKDMVSCGDQVIIDYELFQANGASISNSRHRGTVTFKIGDAIIPHNLERAFYGVKYDQRRAALMSNNREKQMKSSRYHLLTLYQYSKQPYYIEFMLRKPKKTK